MERVRIQIDKPMVHHWSGKFIAPDENWCHISRTLTDFELFLLISGELYIQDDNRRYVVRPGEYLLMSPTELQCGTRTSQCSFYWMHFMPQEGQVWESYNDKEKEMTYEFNWFDIPKQGSIMASERLVVLMKQLQDMDKRYHESMINNYLATTILCEIQNQMQPEGTVGEDDKKQLVGDIREYVKMHIDEPIKVQDVAENFGYNDKYLTTMFHRSTGMSIKEYIIMVKMDRARTLLRDSNFPISEIADSVGFRSVQQFSAVFRKIEGMTPSAYRSSYPSRLLFNR